MNWGDHFDAIYCVNLADNRHRRALMEGELRRVGILDSGIFRWKTTVRNPLYRYIWTHPDFNTEAWWLDIDGALNCTLAHYEIYLEGIAMDYERVLVTEDDVRFLKDIDEITRILEAAPDYDICLFDKYTSSDKRQYTNTVRDCKVNTDYFRYDGIHLLSTGCYAVSARAMRTMAKAQEEQWVPADSVTNKQREDGLIRVAPVTNLAVQDMRLKPVMNEVDYILYSQIADLTQYNLS